jgi:biopolymer transport protein ExbD
MSRFKSKKSGGIPQINTGSMSDIIFMFLFFFIVISTIRETTLIVKIKVPLATEVMKLEKKSLVCNIYAGLPNKKELAGSGTRIQLNDQYATANDIGDFIATERQSLDEADRRKLTVSLKVDRDTKMGIVADIKQELRKYNALLINYSTRKTTVGNLFTGK